MVAFWFRRDLRLEDNTGLYHALNSEKPVLPVFIFDQDILAELPEDDARVTFIYQKLAAIHQELQMFGSSLDVRIGEPLKVWQQLMVEYPISCIYTNEDYEPYAIKRDEAVKQLATSNDIRWSAFKDQVVFGPDEVVKPSDGRPYTIYTPFKNRWLERYGQSEVSILPALQKEHFFQCKMNMPTLADIGFTKSKIEVKAYSLVQLDNYQKSRDFPAMDSTSYLGVHLRFGTVSVRQIIDQMGANHSVFLSELIWREFFMQILYHYPHVIEQSFKVKYDYIQWRNDEKEFEKWCNGETGYPLVDAGMRQLNQTGYMHNRVRMVVASFLCKHLLIDWRWGEAYFALKLLDYELSSNNGNWQWAAGTGCDAAPYFRVFNPTTQLKKFDPEMRYVKSWVKEYLPPMVDHKIARLRALDVYKAGIDKSNLI